MPAFLNWISQHWFSCSIIVLALIAAGYVLNKRKSLFYKE